MTAFAVVGLTAGAFAGEVPLVSIGKTDGPMLAMFRPMMIAPLDASRWKECQTRASPCLSLVAPRGFQHIPMRNVRWRVGTLEPAVGPLALVAFERG